MAWSYTNILQPIPAVSTVKLAGGDLVNVILDSLARAAYVQLIVRTGIIPALGVKSRTIALWVCADIAIDKLSRTQPINKLAGSRNDIPQVSKPQGLGIHWFRCLSFLFGIQLRSLFG